MKRKTKAIEFLIETINNMLCLSTINQDGKKALCELAALILREYNCYGGYQNLYWLTFGFDLWKKNNEPDYPEKANYINNNGKEEYSRVYYIS